MRILLFDLDGTLVRAGGAGRKALNRAVQNVFGVRRDCGAASLAGKTDLRNFEEAIRAAVGRRPRRAEIDRVHREYVRVLPRHVRVSLRAKKYRLTPGIRGLLRRLSREKDVFLGLGTGNIEQGARIKLAPSGLGDYFLFGGFGSDSYHRPAVLRKAVQRARRHLEGRKVSPGDVYVIGDTPLDVAAGKKAGYRTIAVGTGFGTWRELVRSRPDHLAKDFRDVRQWLRWLGLEPKSRRSAAGASSGGERSRRGRERRVKGGA
ncbi:MAG: HAD family hydrolase [Elusimicrobiota bacterium]